MSLYTQICMIIVCSITAIALAIYSIPVIYQNNEDIDKAGRLRLETKELLTDIGFQLFPIQPIQLELNRIKINGQLLNCIKIPTILLQIIKLEINY